MRYPLKLFIHTSQLSLIKKCTWTVQRCYDKFTFYRRWSKRVIKHGMDKLHRMAVIFAVTAFLFTMGERGDSANENKRGRIFSGMKFE